MSVSKQKHSYDTHLRYLVSIALFSALAYIVSFLTGFIKVQFLTFDAKDCIITIGALSLGPVAGVLMAAIVALLEFLLSSTTGVYGLLMNFLSSATFALTASLIYRFRRSFLTAILSLSASVVLTTGVMMLANYLITPFYMGVPRSAVAEMIPTLLLPFNLIKSALNAALTLLLYKRVTHVLVRTRLIEKQENKRKPLSSSLEMDGGSASKRTNRIRTLVVSATALLLLFAGLAVYFIVLDAHLNPFWK